MSAEIEPIAEDAPCGAVRQKLAAGNWPVMLTPFRQDLSIDFFAYEKLIEFYLARGAAGLFAVCHSSEMDFLSAREINDLVKATVSHVNGRVSVVASLGRADSFEEYARRAADIADLGLAGVVFTCSTLVTSDEDDTRLLKKLQWLALRIACPIGLYEAPIPYHRLVSDEAFQDMADSGLVSFFKDTCCQEERVKRRAALCEKSSLSLYNAHMPSLLETLRAGISGYSGIGSNYFPELYSSLCDSYATDPDRAGKIHRFLLSHEAELIEGGAYPATAKNYLALRGVPLQRYCRKDSLLHLQPGLDERQEISLSRLREFMTEIR